MQRTILITGATGFVGAAVVRRLLEAGDGVKALVRKNGDLRNLDGLKLELVYGDLRDKDSLRIAMKGCQRLYHVAAYYSLWTPDARILYECNVDGTQNILEVAKELELEKIVYTSTVGAIGIPKEGGPGNEETPVALDKIIGHYKRSKYLAEQVALRMARQGLPVVIVNPSAPIGPRDIKPTPTGKMIVDFLKGFMIAYIDTGMNLVDVDDVAAGHLLAAEKGRIGEKYILGHRNMTLKEISDLMSRISGVPAPKFKIPREAVLPFAYINQWISDYITKKPPLIPLDGVRMAKEYMHYDSTKAIKELGLPQTPIEIAMEKAIRWFKDHDYV
ncbi:MAG TPA: hopanoid-associated sugar epimerase [Nitrospiria bacterium]|jgi:dihydroflavonol-4-reductase|nr:hopanoid-associated sugar epimerase [Nitrospiria bacterium]